MQDAGVESRVWRHSRHDDEEAVGGLEDLRDVNGQTTGKQQWLVLRVSDETNPKAI